MVMHTATEIREILSHYARPTIHTVEPLGGTGFSGASLWRLQGEGTSWCLRRWPAEHPTRERLSYIHQVLFHVSAAGFRRIPVPVPTREGLSFVEAAGRLWELTPWLPGRADFAQQPGREKLEAALRILAQFHHHAATFQGLHGVPPGIVTRREQIDRLLNGDAATIEAAAERCDWPELRPRARRLVDRFHRNASQIRRLLERAERSSFPLQPCIRDIWHDHVLFVGSQVTGLIDFGALRIDHVAADIARLLGSLVADDAEGRRVGLEAYQSARVLTGEEQWLVEVYDRSSVLLSGMNWLEWICVEKREFPDPARVLQRIDEILSRQAALPSRQLL